MHETLGESVRDTTQYLARYTQEGDAPDLAMAADILNPQICPEPSKCYHLLDPGTVKDLRFSAARLGDGYVRIEADVEFTLFLLPLISQDATLTFTVAHEQPRIGG